MARARYHYELHNHGQILVVYDDYDDSNPTMSVTNDMENVLDEIEEELGALPKVIIYKDTEGMYDGVHYSDGVVEFYHVGGSVLQDALNKVVKLFF